jgi:hypothetical protein
MNDNSNNRPKNLSYYRLSLVNFLNESHPDLSKNETFINTRSEEAATVYEQSIKSGYNAIGAAELANEVLFADLHFSKYDVLKQVLWDEFPTVPEEKVKSLAMKLLPECEDVFIKYPICNDFVYEPEFDQLYTELTGAIAIYLEEHGIQ